MSEPIKTCTNCGVPKPLASFSPQNSPVMRNHRRSRCKTCSNAAGKRWRERQAVRREESACVASRGAGGQPEQETPVEASQTPAIPAVVALSACACPVVALCRHCGGKTAGDVTRCDFCRLPVKAGKLCSTQCTTLGLFSSMPSQRGQSVTTNQAGYHRGRGGVE